MTRWSQEQIEKLASDDRSIKAARGLVKPGPWSEIGATEALVWGKCQGSGKKAYQVSVDLNGPAFKCTCPSRKFPCKHSLALLMLWGQGEGSVSAMESPAGFADEWASGRQDRATKRKERADKPVDPVAQAKRLADRMALMDAGVEDLLLWLSDVMRHGVAHARSQPFAWWNQTATRLVDAQLPGLAQRVRSLGTSIHQTDWIDPTLHELGRLYLAARTWQRRDELALDDRANLRTFLGWSWQAAEIRSAADREHVEDEWLVMGVRLDDESDRISTQRTWCRGRSSAEIGLLLDFSSAGASVLTPRLCGATMSADVSWYPGTGPRRMLLPEGETPLVDSAPGEHEGGSADQLPGALPLQAALSQATATLARNPFADIAPLTIDSGRFIVDASDLFFVGADDHVVPCASDVEIWAALARTGGASVSLFGEWEHGRLRPLTLYRNNEMIAV